MLFWKAFAFFALSRESAIVRPESKIFTASSTPDQVTAGRKYDKLVDWLKSNDAEINEKIDIRPSDRGGGFGAFVTESVAEDELLFTVPRTACLTLEEATGDPNCGEAFTKLIEKAGPGGNTVVMAGFMAKQYLLVMEDVKNGKESDNKWAPYFQTLPWDRGVNNQEHILFWSEDMIESLLKGSLCYGEATALRSEVDYAIKIMNGIVGNSIRAYRGEEVNEGGFSWPWESKPPAPEGLPEGLPEAIKGAFVCLLTRAFQDGDDEGDEEKLVPMLDMLQHCDTPNVRHAKRKTDGTVEVRARCTIQAGEELLNQYRSEEEESMPYSRFFTRFGFVPGIMEPIENLLKDKSSIFYPSVAEV